MHYTLHYILHYTILSHIKCNIWIWIWSSYHVLLGLVIGAWGKRARCLFYTICPSLLDLFDNLLIYYILYIYYISLETVYNIYNNIPSQIYNPWFSKSLKRPILNFANLPALVSCYLASNLVRPRVNVRLFHERRSSRYLRNLGWEILCQNICPLLLLLLLLLIPAAARPDLD